MPQFEREGFVISWEEAGDPEAPPVVVLHGFTSDNRMWLPAAEILSEDYRVIAPDLRGHGLTSAPEDPAAYTMAAYAEDVRALADHLDLDLFALIGCSFGGMVALQYATESPERLAGLVITDSSAAYDREEYDEAYRKREARIDAQVDVAERFGIAELGKRAARDVADPFIAEGIRKRFARLSRDGYLGAARVRRERPDLLPVLAERLTMPVLICIGENDPVRSASELMAERLPAARVLTFKGTGHGIPAIQPDAFARETLRFFADIEEGKTIAGKRMVG